MAASIFSCKYKSA